MDGYIFILQNDTNCPEATVATKLQEGLRLWLNIHIS